MASHVAVAHEWPPWTSPPIKRANLWTGRDDVALATLARRYEAWRRTRAPGAAAIPRTLHQIWLGPRPPPTRLQERAATFKALHPDWTYRLWRDADARAFGLENAAAFAAARNEGARSDVLRYEVLWREGGVYRPPSGERWP